MQPHTFGRRSSHNPSLRLSPHDQGCRWGNTTGSLEPTEELGQHNPNDADIPHQNQAILVEDRRTELLLRSMATQLTWLGLSVPEALSCGGHGLFPHVPCTL